MNIIAQHSSPRSNIDNQTYMLNEPSITLPTLILIIGVISAIVGGMYKLVSLSVQLNEIKNNLLSEDKSMQQDIKQIKHSLEKLEEASDRTQGNLLVKVTHIENTLLQKFDDFIPRDTRK